jgi:hypothetical protein
MTRITERKSSPICHPNNFPSVLSATSAVKCFRNSALDVGRWAFDVFFLFMTTDLAQLANDRSETLQPYLN